MEYIKSGSRLIFREGSTKGMGEVTEIVPFDESGSSSDEVKNMGKVKRRLTNRKSKSRTSESNASSGHKAKMKKNYSEQVRLTYENSDGDRHVKGGMKESDI